MGSIAYEVAGAGGFNVFESSCGYGYVFAHRPPSPNPSLEGRGVITLSPAKLAVQPIQDLPYHDLTYHRTAGRILGIRSPSGQGVRRRGGAKGLMRITRETAERRSEARGR